MAKDRNYEIALTFDTSTLTDIPAGKTQAQIIYEIIVNIVVLWGKQQGGGLLAEQKLLYKIRKGLEEAVRSKSETIKIGEAEFEFLDKCRNEGRADFLGNEVIIRVNELLDKAKEDFVTKYGESV